MKINGLPTFQASSASRSLTLRRQAESAEALRRKTSQLRVTLKTLRVEEKLSVEHLGLTKAPIFNRILEENDIKRPFLILV